MYIDTNKTVHVLVPGTSHGASTWDAFTHRYGVPVDGVMSTHLGVVVFVPVAGEGNAGNLRKLSRLARAPIPTPANPLFIIPDARPEEMALYGFDYRFAEGHPMHYIGKIETAVFVAPPPAPNIEEEETTKKHAAKKIGFWFVRMSRRRMARELENVRKQLSAETRAKEKQVLRLKTALKKEKQALKKEKQALNDAHKKTESDRDQLLQNVLCERDSARRERDDALKQASGAAKALERMNAVPVVTAVTTDTSDAQEHKAAFDTLSKFSKYRKLDQLLSFVHKHNKNLKAELKSLVNDNKRLEKQCHRLETDHHAKIESLKKTLKAMQIQVSETKRFETYARICAKLMEMTGARNGNHLENILKPLYEVASDFTDFGGCPPLAAFICCISKMRRLIGRFTTDSGVQTPSLFALYSVLEGFNEKQNTVDALTVLSTAMRLKGCDTLSSVSVKFSNPSLMIEVGGYDATLSEKAVPKVWTEESKKDAYHFCMHHTCKSVGNNSLLEIMLALQDAQPVSISRAGSRIYMIFLNLLEEVSYQECGAKFTHLDLLRFMFAKCELFWRGRPCVIKCKDVNEATRATRALGSPPIASPFQLAGVPLQAPESAVILARMAKQWPNYSPEDEKTLVESEGKYLTEKHMFTLACVQDPLGSAAHPWCTTRTYMSLRITDKLWDIVILDQNIENARKILVCIFGCGRVSNRQIEHLRQILHNYARAAGSYIRSKGALVQRIKVTNDIQVVIDPANPQSWHAQIATQLGCPYASATDTTDQEYWHFIAMTVAKKVCDISSDWHLSVQDRAVVKKPKIWTAKDGLATPAQVFMQTVNDGLRKAGEEGQMSESDIAELRETAESLQTKLNVKFVQIKNDKLRKAGEEGRSEGDIAQLRVRLESLKTKKTTELANRLQSAVSGTPERKESVAELQSALSGTPERNAVGI